MLRLDYLQEEFFIEFKSAGLNGISPWVALTFAFYRPDYKCGFLSKAIEKSKCFFILSLLFIISSSC